MHFVCVERCTYADCSYQSGSDESWHEYKHVWSEFLQENEDICFTVDSVIGFYSSFNYQKVVALIQDNQIDILQISDVRNSTKLWTCRRVLQKHFSLSIIVLSKLSVYFLRSFTPLDNRLHKKIENYVTRNYVVQEDDRRILRTPYIAKRWLVHESHIFAISRNAAQRLLDLQESRLLPFNVVIRLLKFQERWRIFALM